MTRPELTYTAATEQDADAVAALVNRAYRGDIGWTRETDIVTGDRITPAAISALVNTPDTRLLLARQGDRLVACVCVQAADGEAHIGTFAVDPDLQNRGIGKQLLDAAERHAIETWGATRLTMTVIRQRPELIAFYERRGYRRSGVVAPYPVHLDVGTPLQAGLALERLEKPA